MREHHQIEWISSFASGGDIVTKNSSNHDSLLPSSSSSHTNLDSILAELRTVGEIEHTFRVVQIGRAMLRRPPPSVASLQLVLRDFYFNYRRYGSPAMQAEHLLTISSRGLLFTTRDPSGEIERVKSARFGPDAIVQANAVRFVTKLGKSEPSEIHQTATKNCDDSKTQKFVKRAPQALLAAVLSLTGRNKKPKRVSGRFCVIDKQKFSASMFNIINSQQEETPPKLDDVNLSPAAIQTGSQPPWFLVQPDFDFLSHIYHPPIVAFTLRRQQRIRSIDLHVFVCCSDSDAVQLVTFVNALCENASRIRDPALQSMTSVNRLPVLKTDALSLKRNHIIAPSIVDEESYYERDIVKEATAFNNTLPRTSTKTPFINPNVGLSPFGTLTSTRTNAKQKLATPHLDEGSPSPKSAAEESFEKPTIYDVVDADKVVDRQQQRVTLSERAVPVQVINVSTNQLADEEVCYENEKIIMAEESSSLSGNIRMEEIVQASNDLINHGELLPVSDYDEPNRSRAANNVSRNEDDCWSKSEFPIISHSRVAMTAMDCLLAANSRDKKAAMIGDVQAYLGYLP